MQIRLLVSMPGLYANVHRIDSYSSQKYFYCLQMEICCRLSSSSFLIFTVLVRFLWGGGGGEDPIAKVQFLNIVNLKILCHDHVCNY
jgi:hypothetical protein